MDKRKQNFIIGFNKEAQNLFSQSLNNTMDNINPLSSGLINEVVKNRLKGDQILNNIFTQ